MEAQPIAKNDLMAQSGTPFPEQFPESLLQTLNRMRLTKMRGVEALLVAIRYFSRFPNAALGFAKQAADEARHLAALTGRVIDLGGSLSPNPCRSELLEMLPGFKVDAQGGLDAMVGFESRLYEAQHDKLLFSEETARSLDCDKLTQRIVSRIARDESLHLAAIRTLLDWLAREGHSDKPGAPIATNVQATSLQGS